MHRIICTTQEEKRQWMEASEFLNNKLKDCNLPVVKFLQNIYKEPGNVELQEMGLRVPVTRSNKSKSSLWDKL